MKPPSQKPCYPSRYEGMGTPSPLSVRLYLPLLADDGHSILQLHIVEKALQKHIGNAN